MPPEACPDPTPFPHTIEVEESRVKISEIRVSQSTRVADRLPVADVDVREIDCLMLSCPEYTSVSGDPKADLHLVRQLHWTKPKGYLIEGWRTGGDLVSPPPVARWTRVT